MGERAPHEVAAVGMRILLVDDEPFEIKLLARQLELAGCTDLVRCESAEQALAVLEREGDEVGLLFCDLQMPGMDGVEFVRHLARIRYRGALALISGEDERILQTVERLAQAHGIRVVAALAKPVASDQLRRALLATREAHDGPSRRARRAFIAAELRSAIDGGQLLNHYQPKVDLAAGRLVGVEALARWRHPACGLVFPGDFVPLAEEARLIDDLTRVVLAEALRQVRVWRDAGLNLQVAVNVSMDNLVSLDFPDTVMRMLEATGLAPSHLVLEVTESRLMMDVRGPLDILTRLRLRQIGLSIDDFGTGHSSLVQLRDIPFNELKLDRGFVNGASADPALQAIVEGTLKIARHLGMKTVAEGVEARADWDLLRSLGCNNAQGYFIARPMPAEELIDWHGAWCARSESLRVGAP